MTNTVCMEAALARVGKTKGECAEALGISCRSLHKKSRKYYRIQSKRD